MQLDAGASVLCYKIGVLPGRARKKVRFLHEIVVAHVKLSSHCDCSIPYFARSAHASDGIDFTFASGSAIVFIT